MCWPAITAMTSCASVSHETIYKSLYVQTRGSLRADLHKCLSTKRANRKPRSRTPPWGL